MRRLLAAVAVALVFPGAAFAHANLSSTSPSFRQRLPSTPGAVVLRFDQAIKAEPNAIEVKNEFGKLVSGDTLAAGRVARVPVRKLQRGAYTVRWHVLSEDDHVVSGV